MSRHLLAGITLLPAAVLAQGDIVITITGYAMSAEKALVPVEVLEREDIVNASTSDIGDLLRLSNGLELGRAGGTGQQTSLFFRGTESDHNLVMVNGVPINGANVGSASLGTLDTQLLQRVEVVKGPQSTLWGSSAIGGVTNISTMPTARQGNSAFASAGYGSKNTARISAGFNHRDDDTALSLGIARHSTDGLPTLRTVTFDSGYENTSFNLGASHTGNGTVLEASHWHTQGTTDYTDFQLSPVSQDFVTSVSSLSIGGKLAQGIDSRLQLSHLRDHIDQNNSTDFTRTDRTTLAWRNVATLDNRDKFSFGAEANWEKADYSSFNIYNYQGTTHSQAVFGQYDATRGKHHTIAGARLLNHQDAGRHATWNLGYGYQATPATRLKANVSTGFRYPTATERFVFSPNPNLRPEKSRALELGLSHRIDRAQQIELSLFHTEIDDLIVATGVWPNTRNVNVDEARIQGMEAAYKLRNGPWRLNTSVVFMNPRDLSNNRQLLRRARVSGTARLDYDRSRIHAGAEVIYSGKRDDVQALFPYGATTTDAYTLINLHAAYDLGEALQLFGRLDNALNEDYELAADYNTPGRTLFAGIRYETW